MNKPDLTVSLNLGNIGMNLSYRYGHILFQGSPDQNFYPKVMANIKQQLTGIEDVIVKDVDNSWSSVRWQTSFKEDLQRSGVPERIKQSYIEVFTEGARRAETLASKGCKTVSEYNNERYRKGHLADAYSYEEYIKPMVVLINDNNMMSESSFNKYCQNFIKNASNLAIYFVVFDSTKVQFEVPNLLYTFEKTFASDIKVMMSDGYVKTYISL